MVLGGRLADLAIEVEPLGDRLNRRTVTARPVDVPLVAIAIPDAQATPDILDYWPKTFTCPGNVPCTSNVMSGQSSGPHGADQLRLFTNFLGDTALRFLGDTASRVIPTWSVSNLLNPTFQPCLSDPNRLVGVVTTNATVYGSAPPAFESGSLKHQVAALHRVPGGEVFSGSSEDGTEQVATTSVSERDGWLHLAATGFHFSQSTISVALSSQEPPTKTIVCKRGKKRKKVTGANPVCPTGWRPIAARP